jgi:DNA-directed RNA polymerase subunit L
MELISKLFENQTQFGMILQISIDVVILVLFAVILTVKRPRISKKDEAVVRSLQKIVEETKTISQDFETNLEKRQELLQQVTLRLDQRIQVAQNLCARLEQLSQTAETSAQNFDVPPTAGPRPQNADQQKVLSLARKGLNAAQIAKSIKRPVGEVELILGLRKIAP